MLAERQGTAIWAAKLSDPVLIDQLEAEMKKSGPIDAGEFRPSLYGFDSVASGLHQVANQLISMRIEQGNHKLKHLPGPVFPAEIVDDRLRRFAKMKRDDVIARSQARNAERRGLKINA